MPFARRASIPEDAALTVSRPAQALPMTKEPMPTPDDTPEELDELARKRAERASAGELELRDRVRDDARRSARRMAAAERARRRSGVPNPPGPPGGGSSGAA